MFFAKKEETGHMEKNKVYRFLKKFLPLMAKDGNGKVLHAPEQEEILYNDFCCNYFTGLNEIGFCTGLPFRPFSGYPEPSQ